MKNTKQSVLFICEHGSAKSVVATAHFNRLARERNLIAWAISRGTDPDEAIPLAVIHGLKSEGLSPGESKPKLLSKVDIAAASRIVSFCDLPEDVTPIAPIARWDDVPPISEDYDKSRNAILVRISQLFEEMTAKS